MKPASIISLIVAAVIIVIGIVTCTVANSKANQSGNLLFAETRGEDSVNTIDISGRDLIKVSLNFGDADVSIYGTTGESYIEFINFPESFTSAKIKQSNDADKTPITSAFTKRKQLLSNLPPIIVDMFSYVICSTDSPAKILLI